VGLPVPVALRDLMDLADLMTLVVLPGSADLIDQVDLPVLVDLVADEVVPRAAVRLRVLAHRQASAGRRVQGKAGVTSGSSCSRSTSASPGRFRSSLCAS
jgi:hypothetical protein